MSAQAGWYPDPGGGFGLYRYWDGRAWSAATSPHPAAPPPAAPLGSGGPGGNGWQPGAYPGQSAYADYQRQTKQRSPVGWWIGAAALLAAIVVVAVLAVRAIGNGTLVGGGDGSGQATEQACPPETSVTSPVPHPNDGRVYGGPLSYPMLGSPWSLPRIEDRVPFGSDVATQVVDVEPNYQPGSNWVASVLVGELQAGDGFYTPQQGSQIVVKCILGKFYGDNPVNSDVAVDQATTVDGHEGWLVESHLTFDIEGLETKGELLIVAIVSAGDRSGLYYASIPDTTPQLVEPARDLLQELRVEG